MSESDTGLVGSKTVLRRGKMGIAVHRRRACATEVNAVIFAGNKMKYWACTIVGIGLFGLAARGLMAAPGATVPLPTSAPSLAVHPFDLQDVRLLDSPFKQAMQRDADYLLRLEPDRFLSGYRSEAGLVPKGAKYGGWEQRGIAGEMLGHYLSACSEMFASTGDTKFLDRVN